MKEILLYFKSASALVGAFLGYTLGGLDGFLYTLLIMVVIDYICGVMRAVLERKLSSRVGFRGIFKKMLIFCLVAVGHIIDENIIGSGSVLRTAVIFFYISNEGISILENVSYIGLPIPNKLKEVLEQLKEEKEND